jgi:hypothetical protein
VAWVRLKETVQQDLLIRRSPKKKSKQRKTASGAGRLLARGLLISIQDKSRQKTVRRIRTTSGQGQLDTGSADATPCVLTQPFTETVV